MLTSKPFWLFVGSAIILTLAVWSLLHWIPWWPRHVWQETRLLKDAASETLLTIFHFLIYFGSIFAVWSVRDKLAQHDDHKARRAMKLVLWMVVFVVIVVDTCIVSHFIREVTSQDARARITNTNILTDSLLQNKGETSSLVIQDQAITKIVSQIYTIVQNTFPEIEMRAVSVHVIPSSRHTTGVWNLVQVGRDTKDKEFLPRYKADGDSPGSIIAAAIEKHRTFYCEDVSRAKELGGDCTPYAQPEIKPDYIGLACFPILPAYGTVKTTAGICVDGGSNHRWDRLDALEKELNSLTKSLEPLIARMNVNANDRCLFEP